MPTAKNWFCKASPKMLKKKGFHRMTAPGKKEKPNPGVAPFSLALLFKWGTNKNFPNLDLVKTKQRQR